MDEIRNEEQRSADQREMTEDNAPLFLVMEVTKKTMKMVYVDTPDFFSDIIFQEKNLKIKRLNVQKTKDDRFVFSGCRISARDSEKFRTAVEELEQRLVLKGYPDYRNFSLNSLIELLEDSVNEAAEPDTETEEYPKSVFVPFLPQDSLEESLLACYSFAKMEDKPSEVMIFNSSPGEPENAYIPPADAFALVLRPKTPITYAVFRRVYERHRMGISGITALDKEGKKRVSILLLPEQAYLEQNIPISLVATFYNRETEADITDLFIEWEKKYLEIMAEELHT